MKSSESASLERFTELVHTLPQCEDVTDGASGRSTDDLVFGFLLWESTLPRARAAFDQLNAQIVDANELRVCLPNDFAAIIGPKYPRAALRGRRIKAVLNDLYHRHDAVTLDHTRSMTPTEAAKYFASLDGMHRFVRSHLATRLGLHAFPVDQLLISALVEYRIIDAPTARHRDRAARTEQWLAQVVPESRRRSTHLQLRQWLATVEHDLKKKRTPNPPQR